MGFFYRAPGGDSGNDLTFPTAPVTLDANTVTFDITLTNPGTTPASVELSFQNSNMIGLDPDSGTESSPSYVVDPDAGSRVITLERSNFAPSNLTEQVALTSNQGTITLIDFTLDRLEVHSAIRNFAGQNPIYEFRFDGNFNDTGTRASTTTALNSPTAVSDTTDLGGFVGYADTFNNQSVQISGTQDIGYKTGQPRSYFWVARLDTAPDTSYYVGHLLTSPNQPFFLRLDIPPMGSGTTWADAIDFSTFNYKYDTNQSHTDGGSSVAMSISAGTEIAILYTHDGGTGLTVRWKTLNGNTERTGHSFVTDTRSTGASISNPKAVGWAAAGVDWRQRHFSIYDTALSEADFIKITELIGFGA